jgi:hypothetical protein
LSVVLAPEMVAAGEASPLAVKAVSKRSIDALPLFDTYSLPVAAGFGVGVAVGLGVGVGVPPPPPSVRRGEMTHPTIRKRLNTAVKSRTAIKLDFDLNTWSIVIHHNPVYERSNGRFMRVFLKRK